ncbi:MAG: aspartate aminotransferase family protein [Paracoccaceae bacterium]
MPDHIFARSPAERLPVAVRGDGCYLIDATGKRYLDGSGGAAVSCLGHSDAGLRAALHDQLDRLAFAHTSFFTSDPAETLADRLIAGAPNGLDRVYLVSGGSEAVESALKLARQYFTETGQPQRHRVIARESSYHGNTMGALAAGGNAARRALFRPLLVETSHIPACYAYRGMAPDETPEAYGLRMAQTLEDEILRLGPETVMAFVAETVVGASLGAVTAAPGYFRRIREICDRHGVLLILDEVMCGMGRTGHLFACEAEGISPDMITIAKGLGAGYQPIGAVLTSAAIHDAIANGSGTFVNGHTYMGHPMAAAAANAVLDAIHDRDLLARVRIQGARLQQALEAEFGQHPHIGDIRGRGLFRGIEIVENRETRAPFDPARKIHSRIKALAFDAGLICYPLGGSVAGHSGDHVLLAPPYIIENAQIDELVTKLATAIRGAIAA